MGSTDELQAFSYTVTELSKEYIEKYATHENIPDLFKTIAEQAGGVELFDNDGTFRVKGNWLSVCHAQSYFVEFLRTYSESKIPIEPNETPNVCEQDEKVFPLLSDISENEASMEDHVTSVEEEVIEYLNRKAVASCTVPVTRKRSFVNGKPNTVTSASSIPDPIVLLSSYEQQKEFSRTPIVESTSSRKKSIQVLRDLYHIDKNLKSLKTSIVFQGKKKSVQNKKIDLERDDLPIKVDATQVESIEQTLQETDVVKTGLEDGDDSSSNLTAPVQTCSSSVENCKPFNESEHVDITETTLECKTDDVVTQSNDEKASDDITYYDDDSLDPDYNSDGSDFSFKKTKTIKTYLSKPPKMKTRSSMKKTPVLTDLSVKKRLGRPRKASSKKLGAAHKFTSTRARTSDDSAVTIKKEECTELKKEEKRTRGRPKGGGSKASREYNCKSCPYITPRKSHLREHERRCHMTKTFKCEICHKIFGFGKDLNRHRRTHLKPENCCDICGKLYKGVKTLAQHKLTHDSEYVKPEFSCEVCNKSFSTKYVLAYHIKSEHLGMKRRFFCPTCGKSFSQKNSYIQHANVHMGYKPFRCEVCGKSFSYDKSLKEHKFMHDEMKRFNCPICGKAFRQSSAITIHLKVHKETKDYVCSACGKGFSQKQALVRHERIHLGEKPFACQLCQRTFTDSSVLRRHMILIHKKDPKKWREDTKQNTVRRADFFISVIGEKNKAEPEKDLPEGTEVNSENGMCNRIDDGETESLLEDCGDVKETINISSTAAESRTQPIDLLCVDSNNETCVTTLQQIQQHQPQLDLPVQMSQVHSGQQQVQQTRPLAEIIPKTEMHIQNVVMLSEDQILGSSQIEHVDSKAHLHLLDQRNDGFINQTHPSILPYNLVGTTDFNFPAMVIIPETSSGFASTINKGNYSQTPYVGPNTSTSNHANLYSNYPPPDG